MFASTTIPLPNSSHKVWEFGRSWEFYLGFPGLEKFGNLPWILGILFSWENVKILRIYRFNHNLNFIKT